MTIPLFQLGGLTCFQRTLLMDIGSSFCVLGPLAYASRVALSVMSRAAYMPTTRLLRKQLVGSKLLRHSSEKPLSFLPMVRLNQRRWQVSVPSANANHNVVSLGLTSWWNGHGRARDKVLFRFFILNPSHKRFLCRKKIVSFHFQFMADGPPTLLRTMSLVRRGLMSVPP